MIDMVLSPLGGSSISDTRVAQTCRRLERHLPLKSQIPPTFYHALRGCSDMYILEINMTFQMSDGLSGSKKSYQHT